MAVFVSGADGAMRCCAAVHRLAAIDCMITLRPGGHTGFVCSFVTPLMDMSHPSAALYILACLSPFKKTLVYNSLFLLMSCCTGIVKIANVE